MASMAKVGGGVGEAVDEFYLAFGEFLSDVDTVGDADEFRVLELDARALVAVVEQDVEAGGFEFGGDLLAGGDELGLARVGDADDDLEGGDAGGEGVLLRNDRRSRQVLAALRPEMTNQWKHSSRSWRRRTRWRR